MFIVPMSQLTPLSGLGETQPAKAQSSVKVPFADMLQESMQALQESQEVASKDSFDLAMGRSDDIHTISIHSAQKTAALELTVQIASRAVSAYKEILQMQV